MFILREVAISRDPFSRSDTMRGLVDPGDRRACDWCGSRPGRFIYWDSPDGLGPSRTHAHRVSLRTFPPAFCSKGCHDSYSF